MSIGDFYKWGFRKYPIFNWNETSKYYGKRCKLLNVGNKNSVLIQFDDGYKVITTRMGLRKIKNTNQLELFGGCKNG